MKQMLGPMHGQISLFEVFLYYQMSKVSWVVQFFENYHQFPTTIHFHFVLYIFLNNFFPIILKCNFRKKIKYF